MAKKMVKKKKLKIFRLLILLLIIVVIFIGVDLYLNTRIKNINIKNTSYLSDDYILELAGIKDYPSFYFTSSSKIKKGIKSSPYVESVKVEKWFYHVINITVKEEKPLFFYVFENKIGLADNTKVHPIDYEFRIPRVLNEIPADKYKKFVKGMSKVKEDILGKISDIEYVPNEYDKDRFILYMDDGNAVYLTLTKFNMINYYDDVVIQLEGRKGILYLDSGNHFRVME